MTQIKRPSEAFIESLLERKIPLRVEFMTSGMKLQDLPEISLPEIALVGRSNVGKSSLLNFLSGQRQLARVSNTPGRTQTINLFSVEKSSFVLADLPGYGYAESAKETQAHWQNAMSDYFQYRKNLVAVFFLVDIRREILPEDEALSRWLQDLGIKVTAIQTKSDKVNKSKLPEIRIKQSHGLALSTAQIITTSAEKKIGLSDILIHTSSILSNIENDE
ncbi:MAG: ribosome biogenesis GTP-binding protein YihA/YsxC [Silvanigrellaceae bacterium]|nr:ribosome biogenesis GTP-binding protein YihA/YsxC [Silvanigrellaceae bacterium]